MMEDTMEEKRNLIYIARVCDVDGDYVKRIEGETAFSSHEKAFEYVRKEIVECPLEALYKNCIVQICEFELNPDEDGYSSQKWHYDMDGTLLEHFDFRSWVEEELIPKSDAFLAKYALGDIVYLRETGWSSWGPGSGAICVLSEVPLSYDAWKKTEQGQQEGFQPDGSRITWIPGYSAVFLTPFGRLEHDHPSECDLEPLRGPLPEQLWFLRHLSDHYKGIRKIKGEALYKMYEGGLVGFCTPTFGEEHFEE